MITVYYTRNDKKNITMKIQKNYALNYINMRLESLGFAYWSGLANLD